MKITIVRGDITKLKVDAIVNAANPTLLGGGGVDGAIHRAAGPKLLEECERIRETKYPKGLPTGEAIITLGYNLPAKYVIHTVGPIYGRDSNPEELLADCFTNSLRLAEQMNLKSIAFPAISTGAYGFPKSRCAEIAKEVLSSFKFDSLEDVTICLFTDDDNRIFKKIFGSR